MLIACYGNIGSVIRQAEGFWLARFFFFLRPHERLCEPAGAVKNRQPVGGGSVLVRTRSGDAARGLPLCSDGNLSERGVGNVLTGNQLEQNYGGGGGYKLDLLSVRVGVRR